MLLAFGEVWGSPTDMPKQILIIDDNLDDSQILERFLRKKGVANPVRVLRDGLAAIDYLYGLEPYSNRQLHPFPALVFLDISMPRKTGYDVLEWLNSHLEVPTPKVIICTHAIGHNELEKCYRLGATSFLLKQTMEEQFRNLLTRYPDIWEFGDPPAVAGALPAPQPFPSSNPQV
jgi:CheY-like chemotaxis protein